MFANFYQDFITRFSDLTRYLTNLTGKNTPHPFILPKLAKKAFNLLKNKIIAKPALG